MSSIFDKSGNWYKGNLHMHTTLSDGHRTPEEAVELYRNSGYDFLALTDHWKQSETKMSGELLLLSGCEWDTGSPDHVFHFVGVGMERPVILEHTQELKPREIIREIGLAGGLAVLAHPAWSLTDPDDCMMMEGIAGIEIYNTFSTAPWNGRRADSSLYVDLCAARGKLLRCMAADDCHYYTGEQTRSFIMVKAPELSADSIKKAIRDGDFYASQGPLFESVTVEDGVVEVHCSEVEAIVFYSNTVYCKDRVTSGGVRSAVYHVKPTDRYLRIELIDSDGNMAWTSPVLVR